MALYGQLPGEFNEWRMATDTKTYRYFFRRGSALALGTNVIGALLALALTVLLTRIMTVESYGTYAYVVSWINIAVIVSTLGFDLGNVKFISQYLSSSSWAEFWGIIRFSNQVVLISSGICALAFVVSGILLERAGQDELAWTFFAASVLIPVLSLNGIRQSVLRALKHIGAARFPDIILRPTLLLIFSGGIFLFDGLKLNAPSVMFFHGIAAAFALLLGGALVAKSCSAYPRPAQARSLPREWIGTSLPLLLVTGMHIVISEVDSVMLGLMKPISEVAIYSVAMRISTVMLLAQQASNTIAAPLIAQCYAEGDLTQLQTLCRRIIKWTATLSVPIFIGLLVGSPLLPSLFGAEYGASIVPLIILLFGQLVSIATGPAGYLLTMTGHQNENLRVLLISLALAVLLNVPAIYLYGVTGAASATMIVIAWRSIALWRSVRRFVGVDGSVLALLKH